METRRMKMGNGFKDLTGQRFGRLTVLELDPEKPRGRGAWWKCRCDCGSEVSVRARALQEGGTQSCNCLRWETNPQKRQLQAGEAGFNQLYAKYKKNARRRKLSFELSVEKFRSLTEGECWYCGEPPSAICKEAATPNGHYRYNGVDRVDPSIGYTERNCVSCCATCNYAKGDRTLEEFARWLERAFFQMQWRKVLSSATKGLGESPIDTVRQFMESRR